MNERLQAGVFSAGDEMTMTIINRTRQRQVSIEMRGPDRDTATMVFIDENMKRQEKVFLVNRVPLREMMEFLK